MSEASLVREVLLARYAVRAVSVLAFERPIMDYADAAMSRAVYRVGAEGGARYVVKVLRGKRMDYAPAFRASASFPGAVAPIRTVGGDWYDAASGVAVFPFLESRAPSATDVPALRRAFEALDLWRPSAPGGLPTHFRRKAAELSLQVASSPAVSAYLRGKGVDPARAASVLMGYARRLRSASCAFVHGSLWAENALVLPGGEVRIIDWDGACFGDPTVDRIGAELACWSLSAGSPPRTFPARGDAALFFAARILPDLVDFPRFAPRIDADFSSTLVFLRPFADAADPEWSWFPG